MTGSERRVRLLLLGVPRHLRDSVLGDLVESNGDLRDALGIALHFQAEPYRAGIDRRCVLLLLLAAAGVLWVVPMAAHSLLAQASVFVEPVSRAVLQLWSLPALVASVACGLLVGRASLLPANADAARLHLVLLLAPAAALAAPSAAQAILAALLLPAAAWLAQQNRLSSTDDPEAA